MRQTHRKQKWFHSRRIRLRRTILRILEAPCQSSTLRGAFREEAFPAHEYRGSGLQVSSPRPL
jgi:hypothetical protein